MRNNSERFDFTGRDKKPMVSAICDNCGNKCKLPFKPTGDKPVYCSDCFEHMGHKGKNRRNDRDGRRGGRDSHSRPSFNKDNTSKFIEKKVDDLNYKVDQIMKKLDELIAQSS